MKFGYPYTPPRSMTAATPEHRWTWDRARAAGPAHCCRPRAVRASRWASLPWLWLAVIACSEEAPAPSAVREAPVQTQEPVANPPVAAPQPTGNQLHNPGFEDKLAVGFMNVGDGWGFIRGTRWIGFEVVDQPIHSGRHAARLLLSWQPGDREQPISAQGAIQEISPPRCPDRLAGWYRVDHWENQSDQTLLYLDVAVAAVGDPRARDIVIPDDPELHPDLDNYQIRYYMAGLTEPYDPVLNMRTKLVREGPPELGEWVYFDFPIKADFQELWGAVPADFSFLRVFFEVRWEEKEEGAALRADIYYDDLFFGFDEPPES